MQFTSTKLDGVYLIDIEPHGDERGFFARSWCADEFAQRGLVTAVAQISQAFTFRRGTLRGLHYQAAPGGEEKLVRCVRGAAFVVAVDVRSDSLTHRQWVGAELSADNRRAIYVPQGCVQGYQTLRDDTELIYQMSQFYFPDMSRGYRFDDPAFNVRWPLPVSVISEKDRNWPAYEAAEMELEAHCQPNFIAPASVVR